MSLIVDAGHLADQPVAEQARHLADEEVILPLGPQAEDGVVALARACRAASGMSAGSFCRSPSMVTMTSPAEKSMPACRAADWPKLRRRRTTLTCTSRPASVSSAAEGAVARCRHRRGRFRRTCARRPQGGGNPLMQPWQLSFSSLIGIMIDRSMIVRPLILGLGNRFGLGDRPRKHRPARRASSPATVTGKPQERQRQGRRPRRRRAAAGTAPCPPRAPPCR